MGLLLQHLSRPHLLFVRNTSSSESAKLIMPMGTASEKRVMTGKRCCSSRGEERAAQQQPKKPVGSTRPTAVGRGGIISLPPPHQFNPFTL